MNEEELAQLRRYLENEDYRKLLSFCCEPRDWRELGKAGVKQERLFDIVRDLKLVKALAFANGKYYTTEMAKSLLESI
ncbi:hypothetical protein J7L65_07640 [Candidatus Bathyarchaeota archaeon]|nr:hypothetical protein [Candidatus Bathyarchaeota archaeon]